MSHPNTRFFDSGRRPPGKTSLYRSGQGPEERLARETPPEARIDALLALFATRCATARELRTVGEAMFAALNSVRPRPAVIGRYHERLRLCRTGEGVEFSADGRRLATLRPEEATRLAALLHSASDETLRRLRAA